MKDYAKIDTSEKYNSFELAAKFIMTAMFLLGCFGLYVVIAA